MDQIKFQKKKFQCKKKKKKKNLKTKSLFEDLDFQIEEELKEYLITTIDSDSSGRVSFKEFYEWWSSPNKYKLVELAEKSPDLCNYAITLFHYYDQDKTKLITHSEFEQLFDDFKHSQYVGKKVHY